MAYELGPVKAHVRAAANYFGMKYNVRTIYGFGPGSTAGSDHPKGLALDFMVNKSTGDALAADLVANAGQWNVKYVIWYRRIWNAGKGWSAYHGTSNPHTDHVHTSFNASGTAPDVTVPTPVGTGVATIALPAVFEQPGFWKRIAFFFLGCVLLLLGLFLLVTGQLPNPVKTVRKAVTK